MRAALANVTEGAAIFVNGKFSARPMSGVDRVAAEMLSALDRLIPAKPRRWHLLCPPGARTPTLGRVEVRQVGPRGLPLHLWEQTVLPWAARRGLLLNLAGSAPWFAGTQACFIHDAAVFDTPATYRPLFRWWYGNLFRRHARRGTALVTVSNFSQMRLSAALGTLPQRIGVVPNGADHLQRHPADPDVLSHLGLRGLPYFLALSNGSRAKNLGAVVQAFARVSARHPVQLVVVGHPNRRVFGAIADVAGTSQIVQAGAVSDGALRALMGESVALVFPSLYEGFGLPALEAMSCGCPVLASNVAALPEVCGTAALYADPDSVPDIAHAMESLLVNPALRQRLREAGHRQVARFRWEDSAHTLLLKLGLLKPGDLPTPAAGGVQG
jgi:glycosyltransferase involved in cell wall biosynthesis